MELVTKYKSQTKNEEVGDAFTDLKYIRDINSECYVVINKWQVLKCKYKICIKTEIEIYKVR